MVFLPSAFLLPENVIADLLSPWLQTIYPDNYRQKCLDHRLKARLRVMISVMRVVFPYSEAIREALVRQGMSDGVVYPKPKPQPGGSVLIIIPRIYSSRDE
ncbi:hypothetical protein NPIL_264001 [Nephila pilipes]|uniref:Uncharacterized protein n=1 Tax=Nephila pilipes TaxID=299642 RepID=A0A8X6U005_NEPPI|nr:hypothetical protein NPIL_264001 [Nephila pilipes]